MNPVKFNGVNVIFAKDQPQYRQLPAFVNKEGEVLTEWNLNEAERAAIARGENLRIHTMTFNHPFQPVKPYIQSVEAPEEHADQNRAKESYPVESEAKPSFNIKRLVSYIEDEMKECKGTIEECHQDHEGDRSEHFEGRHEALKCLIERIQENYFGGNTETAQCEGCGKEEPLQYATMDDDANWTCHECFKEHVLTHYAILKNAIAKRIEDHKQKLQFVVDEQIQDRFEAKIEAFEEVLQAFADEEAPES
jgi:hypothetical protein